MYTALYYVFYVRNFIFTASYIGKGCLRDDPNLDECVVRKGAPVIERIVKGDPKYRIPKLDPLIIPEMTIKQGTKQVGLVMKCKNCQLHGLKDTKFVKARCVYVIYFSEILADFFGTNVRIDW